ncbi:MAG: hypothetical protein LBU89_09125 [Fibromonadaceae bacterium]|jgi:uncharacterized protein (TIGR02145 family)|nr:hypothetical protein [Fibromonadaceae bacterium]
MKRIIPCLCVSFFFFACLANNEESINSGFTVENSSSSVEENSSSSIEDANSSASIEAVSNDCTFTDSRDNQSYKCVTIGEQTWMAENLNYAGIGGDLGTCERHSFHESNRTLDCNTYGRLYSWQDTREGQACTRMGCMDGTNNCNTCVGGVCPAGWHLPSKEEWEELIAFAGGNEIAGKKLKTKEGWRRYGGYDGSDMSGTDDYGFSSIAAGKSPESPPFSCPQPECPPQPDCTIQPDCTGQGCLVCVQPICPRIACAPPYPDGLYGETAWWWTSTELDADKAFSLNILSHSGNENKIFGRDYEKSYKMSVRCVKD